MSDDPMRELATMLFGAGADEFIAKFQTPPNPDADQRKRKITAGLSATGAAAGTAGLAYAGHKMASEYKAAPKTLGRIGRFKTAVKSEKGAAVLLPLEVAGLGGEVMATHILHGDTKKQPVAKSEPGSSDVHLPSTGRLKRIAAKKGIEGVHAGYKTAKRKAPEVKRGALKLVNEVPTLGNSNKTKVEVARKEKVGKSVTWEGEISKVDEDKRQVFGWASIVEMNGEPVVDLQGDYIDIDEIEKSAYDYVIKSRKGGEMHRRNGEDPVHVSDMIESFLVTPEKKEKMGLPESMPTGWWVGYQINDDDAWNLVKSGKRTGFSIHGRGQRTSTEI